MSYCCHICLSSSLDLAFQGPLEKFTRAAGRSEGVKYYYCEDCSGLSQHPVLGQDESRDFYERKQCSREVGFETDSVPPRRVVQKVEESRFKKAQMELLNLFSLMPGRRALEIGCGEGALLALLRSEGLEVRGIEPLAPYAEHARRAFGLSVKTGYFSNGSETEASADLVILDNVLEHLENPGGVLAEVRRVLASGGVVYIAVPAADVPDPENANVAHLTLWSRTALAVVLRAAGFAPVGIIGGRPVYRPQEWVCVAAAVVPGALPYERITTEESRKRWNEAVSSWMRRREIVASREARYGLAYPLLRLFSSFVRRAGLRRGIRVARGGCQERFK